MCHYMLTTLKHPGLHSVFQSDLDNLYAWSQQNLMEFKVKKCKLMHITKRKTPIPSDLHLNNRDLKKDDHDGSENVAKKMNLSSFKLNRVYLDPLNMSNAGDFSCN